LYVNSIKQVFKDQNSNEENKHAGAVNELKPVNSSESEMVTLEKYKLEIEQRVNIKLRRI
jgi:hypothetical protein